MSIKTTAPFGTWESPISAELLAGQLVTLSEVHVNVSSTQCHVNQTFRRFQLTPIVIHW